MAKKTILYVEDDENFREFFAGALREEGTYEVITAASSLDALKILENQKPAIVISDFYLQEKRSNGADLTAAVLRFGIPAIILSGSADEAAEAMYTKYKVSIPVLWKPSDPFKVLELVDDLTGTDIKHKYLKETL